MRRRGMGKAASGAWQVGVFIEGDKRDRRLDGPFRVPKVDLKTAAFTRRDSGLRGATPGASQCNLLKYHGYGWNRPLAFAAGTGHDQYGGGRTHAQVDALRDLI
jgi:hypothetical protein